MYEDSEVVGQDGRTGGRHDGMWMGIGMMTSVECSKHGILEISHGGSWTVNGNS